MSMQRVAWLQSIKIGTSPIITHPNPLCQQGTNGHGVQASQKQASTFKSYPPKLELTPDVGMKIQGSVAQPRARTKLNGSAKQPWNGSWRGATSERD